MSLDPGLCQSAKESNCLPQPVSSQVLSNADATVFSRPGLSQLANLTHEPDRSLQLANSIHELSNADATVFSGPGPSQLANSTHKLSNATVSSGPGPLQLGNSTQELSNANTTVSSGLGSSQLGNSTHKLNRLVQVFSNEAFAEHTKKMIPDLFTPLNVLANVAMQLNIVLPPISSPNATIPSTKSDISDGGTTSNSGQANTVNTTEGALSKRIMRMRPGPAQNGRNLCAHRWLKAFKDTSNGTTAEFKVYYDRLSKEQRELYEKEAKDLVSKKAWNKDAFNGTIY